MFLDYYDILEVVFNVSSEDFKNAYRMQSANWHPDKNTSIDTFQKIQLLN